MADRELSTRDLAQSPETDADEVEARESPDRPARAHAEEATPADEPLARERSELEDEPMDAAAEERAGDERPTQTTAADEGGPLLPDDETDRFTTRWREIQIAFVDEPRDSVAKADSLVADVMQRLAASFSDERQRLESQWDRGDDVSTEDLRVALTRYRSFFDRLLSA
jgi:hypothetical protein